MSIDVFKPFTINNKLEISNRFVRSATWDGSADESGRVTDRSLALYKALGMGNIGLIITGHAYVDIDGKSGPGQYGIHDDSMIPGLRRLVEVVHEGGSRVAVQVSHSGQRLYPRNTSAPVISLITEADRPHHVMADSEIRNIINQFAAAADRAKEAGFDAVQLHGGHGYLISQFFSPLSNKRTDMWGGDAQKRRLFSLEVIKSVRKVVGPDFPVLIKLGVLDEKDGGLTIEEGLETARQVAAQGVDAIEVSVGFGNSIQHINDGDPPYFRDYAAAVKKVVSVPVIAVGGNRSLSGARNIIESGDADLISMCRPYICEPHLITRWQQGSDDLAECISCSKCMASPIEKGWLQCINKIEKNKG